MPRHNDQSPPGYAALPLLRHVPTIPQGPVLHPLSNDLRNIFREGLISIAGNLQTLRGAASNALAQNEDPALINQAIEHHEQLQQAIYTLIRPPTTASAHTGAPTRTSGSATPGKAVTPGAPGPLPPTTPAELREKRRRDREEAERRDKEEELKERLLAARTTDDYNAEAARQRQFANDLRHQGRRTNGP